MNKRQTQILGILAAAAGLHIWLDPNTKSSLKLFLNVTPDNWRQIGTEQLSVWWLWFLGLAALMLLSDFAPKIALTIALLILTGAVLVNSGPIVTVIQTATTRITGEAPVHPIQES